MLVQNQRPLARCASWRWSFAVRCATVAIVAMLTSYRGLAAEAEELLKKANQRSSQDYDFNNPSVEEKGPSNDTKRGGVAQAVEAPPANAKPQSPVEHKDQLRYAGRSFGEWRHQLLDDLDEKTCMAAMDAMVAFGKKGYGEEAISALAAVLHDDRHGVVENAAGALRQLGASAVPALTGGLADERLMVRIQSAQALGYLGDTAKPAKDALLKLLDLKREPRSAWQPSPRGAAISALMAIAGDDKTLEPTFKAIVTSNASSDREALRQGLLWASQTHGPFTAQRLHVLLDLSRDDDALIRQNTGYLLATAAPPEHDVIDALRRLLRDLDQAVWMNTLAGLVQSNTNPVTSAIVLVDCIRSADVRERFILIGQTKVAIEQLANAPDQASITVPLLADIVDGTIDGLYVAEVNTAIETLGKLGRAAKAAIPALERRVAGAKPAIEHPGVVSYNEFTPKLAERALRRIAGAADPLPNEDR